MKTLAICCLFLLPNLSSGQIRYVDIQPDRELSAPQNSAMDYYLDLDEDGESDFWFMHFNVSPPGTSLDVFTAQDGDGEILVLDLYNPLALRHGDSIQSHSEQWVCTNNGGGNWALSLDNAWLGMGDRYLGVRIHRQGAWHYGWVRIEALADKSAMIIKDYAWEQEAGTGILAGDAGTTVIDAQQHPGNLEIQRTGRLFTIETRSPMTLRGAVYDMLGALRLTRSDFSTQLRLDLTDFAPGVYFLRAEGARSTRVQRIALF